MRLAVRKQTVFRHAMIALALISLSGAARAQSLEEALATAYSSNPDLRAARATLRAVNEGVPQALSNWRPTVTVTGSAGVQRVRVDNDDSDNDSETRTNEPVEVQGQVTQFLYRGGRTAAETSRAETDVQAERARLIDTEQAVLLDAVTAFSDVWRDQSVLRLNISNERVLSRQLEASRDRFQVGEITRTDVAQSESRLSRATADRIAAEGSLSSSRAVFQQVIGVFPSILEQPNVPAGLPDGLERVIESAIADNPQVVAARFDERSARHQVRVDLGELLPELSLIGDGTVNRNMGGGDERDEVAIRAQLSIPIYQQGFVSSQVRQSKQIASQRRLEIDSARRSVEQTAISAWEALQTARAQIISFNSEVRSTRIALEGVRQENAVGARTILDILDAEQEFLDAQVSLVVAQRDEAVAAHAVLSAVGRLTAQKLALPVRIYNPAEDYNAVKDSWFGLGAPGE